MTVIRDTDFTPSHIIEFLWLPDVYRRRRGRLHVCRNRLPTFACKGSSIAYVLLFVGPFMVFPNVGWMDGVTSGCVHGPIACWFWNILLSLGGFLAVFGVVG